MARAGYDLERLWSAEPGQSLLVELDHAVIRAPDDQERRRIDTIENGFCEIWPPAPGYDGPDTPAEPRGRDESRRGAGACAEQSEPHLMKLRVPIEWGADLAIQAFNGTSSSIAVTALQGFITGGSCPAEGGSVVEIGKLPVPRIKHAYPVKTHTH
jgi:hypothetical protein